MMHTLALELTNAWAWGAVVGVGTAIGLVIAYFASREYINQTMSVLKETIESQEQIISTKEALAASLAETNKQLLASSEKKLEVMTAERDTYRQQLHDTREPMQAQLIKIKELELRPNLNEVLQKEEKWHERREQFYTAMAGNQADIMRIQHETVAVLATVKDTVEKDLEQSHKVCQEVSAGLNGVIEKLNEREEKQAKREESMMEILQAILKELKSGAKEPKGNGNSSS